MDIDELLATLKATEEDTSGGGEGDSEEARKAAEAAAAAKAEEDKKKAEEAARAAAATKGGSEEKMAALDTALGGIQYQTMINDEVSRFFSASKNQALNNPQIKNQIMQVAFASVKDSARTGQMKSLAVALEEASEAVKNQLVSVLQAGAPILREISIKKGKGSDFWEKAKNYSEEDYYRDYHSKILPSMTVGGLQVVGLEKGRGKDKEYIEDGTADHYTSKKKYKTLKTA